MRSQHGTGLEVIKKPAAPAIYLEPAVAARDNLGVPAPESGPIGATVTDVIRQAYPVARRVK